MGNDFRFLCKNVIFDAAPAAQFLSSRSRSFSPRCFRIRVYRVECSFGLDGKVTEVMWGVARAGLPSAIIEIMMRQRKQRTKKGLVGRMLKVVAGCAVAAALVLAATNAAVVFSTRDSIVDVDAASSFDADAVLVLGASVLPDGQPSKILKDRLDCGIALYFAGAAPKIIMSGDNGTASYNEVRAMKNYAIGKGVPSEDIFCDHAGFSTYESVYRAKYVFGVNRLVVATQTYHLYRAVYAAQALGMQAVGVASDYHAYEGQPLFSSREVLARTKDFFKAIAKPPSTFVGEPISLNQSGDVTNG